MRENNSTFERTLLVIVLLIAIGSLGYYLLFMDKDTAQPINQPVVEQSTTTTTGMQGTVTYPEQLPTTYITAVDWPPTIATSTQVYSCIESGNEVSAAGLREQKTVDGTAYCVTKKSEGAAGSTYTTYVYVWQQGEVQLSMRFSVRSVQCMNYDQPKQTECLNERNSFDVDAFADGIAKTLR